MILETALRNILADQIDAAVNSGVGTAQLIFETSADVAVASINLQNPAFGAAAAGVITLAGVPLSDGNAAGGTIAQASVFDRDAAKLWELTVGVAASEIIITSVDVAATEQVDLTGLTITVPTGP